MDIDKVVLVLREEVKKFKIPSVTRVSFDRSPYKVLISCLLSLRTRDEVTILASERLFERAGDVEEMLKLEVKEISELIYPVAFYRVKAKRIKEISEVLVREYGGNVPDELEELLKLKGVGRKTGNLVLTLGFGKLGICVDTHVHKVSNRLGLVETKNPEETEFKLREILPKKYWIEFNDLLVAYGQNVCVPVSPFCSKCKLYGFCERKGVERFR